MWDWPDVRRAIDDSGRRFDAFLEKMPRSEIERLIYSSEHWCNVVGCFDIDAGTAAKAVYDEIKERSRRGR